MEGGLLHVRLTPIATKFCVAEEFPDVHELSFQSARMRPKARTMDDIRDRREARVWRSKSIRPTDAPITNVNPDLVGAPGAALHVIDEGS